MALDQGTSSSRAIIYENDAQGGTRVIAQAQHGFDMHFPADGWVEQDPEVLWQTTLNAGRDAIAASGLNAAEIACIGITNQRETTLLWDRQSGTCVYNAIVWQDRRTADQCEHMRRDELAGMPLEEVLIARTGLVMDPYFSSTKLAWLLHNVDHARHRAQQGELCFGTVDSFLIWRLTSGGAHVTDATNASRTQLFDIHRQAWCADLLDYFEIPSSVLPQVCDSAGLFGLTDAQWFGAQIPITGVAGDQQAALVGQGCFSAGMTKSTYGTGCFLITNTGDQALRSDEKLLTTVAYRIGGKTTYALEGSIFVAGVAIKWLREKLRLIDTPAETQTAFERTGGDAQGVYVVPAFTGLGAPYWQPAVRGLITGLTLDSDRDHVLTAFLQSVVFLSQALLAAMGNDGATVQRLRVDGGMVVNDALCQFLADILDVPVDRPADAETTALGAALLAGLGHGLYANLDAAAKAWHGEHEFIPSMDEVRRRQLLAGFQRALAQALTQG
ncbi:MAG: glycerol kinase GlpK [bacterium]